MWDCMGLYVMIGGMIDVKQFSPLFFGRSSEGFKSGGFHKE